MADVVLKREKKACVTCIKKYNISCNPNFEIKVKLIIPGTTLHFIVVDRKKHSCKHFLYILVNDIAGPLISDENVQNNFNAEDDVPYYPDCQCYDDDRGLDCSDNYRSPPSLLTATQDIMQNITGQSESDYIYYTTDIYRLSRWVGFRTRSGTQIVITILMSENFRGIIGYFFPL